MEKRENSFAYLMSDNNKTSDITVPVLYLAILKVPGVSVRSMLTEGIPFILLGCAAVMGKTRRLARKDRVSCLNLGEVDMSLECQKLTSFSTSHVGTSKYVNSLVFDSTECLSGKQMSACCVPELLVLGVLCSAGLIHPEICLRQPFGSSGGSCIFHG